MSSIVTKIVMLLLILGLSYTAIHYKVQSDKLRSEVEHQKHRADVITGELLSLKEKEGGLKQKTGSAISILKEDTDSVSKFNKLTGHLFK